MRCASVKLLISALPLTLLLSLLVQPGSAAAPAVPSKLGQAPATPAGSIALKGVSTVGDCVTVEAVLLPRKPAGMLFGGFVANNYAVVKTTVSNHCDDQQFILHNIYFDYKDWALSGGFPLKSLEEAKRKLEAKCNSEAAAAKASTDPTADESSNSSTDECPSPAPVDGYTVSSQPGEVGTVGALEVQDQDVEDAVFSPRNKVVKALTLIGDVAQGYAFVGGPGTAQGIGAFNTAFVGSVSKLWPDRRIDQEKYILSLGYRTDRSTAIAKDDHGSYYAFFPLTSFLDPQLTQLFLNDPAVFLNPSLALIDMVNGEVPPEPGETKSSKKQTADTIHLAKVLLRIAGAPSGNLGITPEKLLFELASQCPGSDCPYKKDDVIDLDRIKGEKYLFGHASLNSVSIVVRGIMTVSVATVPPTIKTLTLDNEKQGASLWTVPVKAAATPAASVAAKPAAGAAAVLKPAADEASPAPATKDLTGTITGVFLSGGTPVVASISVPSDAKATPGEYIKAPVQVVSAKSSDSSLAFTLTLLKSVPVGSKLTFQVTRTVANSGGTENSPAGSSTVVTSNSYVYTVGSAAEGPTVTSIDFDDESKTAIWLAPGKHTGTVKGTNLAGATIAPSALEIDGKTATATDYIGAVADVPGTSSATALDFQLTLLKPLTDGSKITFVVSTKAADATLKSDPKVYTVANPKAAAAAPAKKAVPVKKDKSPKPVAKAPAAQ
jgi:hypothetical protein